LPSRDPHRWTRPRLLNSQPLQRRIGSAGKNAGFASSRAGNCGSETISAWALVALKAGMMSSARVEGGARTAKPIRWDSVAPEPERRLGRCFWCLGLGRGFCHLGHINVSLLFLTSERGEGEPTRNPKSFWHRFENWF
jgi:hypothetical protein